MARCRVSYTDTEGLAHSIDVEADSLYEADASADAELREDDLHTSLPAPMTEFTVTVYRKPAEHRIRLHQVAQWAEHTVQEGPAGIVKRQRVRAFWAPNREADFASGTSPLTVGSKRTFMRTP